MRYLNWNLTWAIPATMAIGVIWAVSALANYYFGASMGTDKPFDALFFVTTTSEIFSRASVASDVLKCVMLFAFAAAWITGQWKAAMVSGSIWLVCTAWSVASAVGFVAINHNTVTDTRGKGVEEWSQLETQIANLTERRKQVSTARPEGTVQAEINQLLRTPGVGNCSVINGPATREICPQVDKLKVELENAKSAAWLDGRLDELRGEVRKSDRVTSENPFADLAGGLLGVVATKVTTGQALWFALLLELISGPGLWAIWSAVPKAREIGATAAKAPEATTTAVTLPSPAVAPSRTPLAHLEKVAGVMVPKINPDHHGEVFGEASKNPASEQIANSANCPPDPTGPGTPAPMPEAPKIEEVAGENNVAHLFPLKPRTETNALYRIEADDGTPKKRKGHPEIKDFARECLGIDREALVAMKTAIRDHKPLEKHIAERLMDSPDCYDIYTDWCDENDLTAKSNKAFSGDLWDFVGLPKGTRKLKGVKGLRTKKGMRFPVFANVAEPIRRTA